MDGNFVADVRLEDSDEVRLLRTAAANLACLLGSPACIQRLSIGLSVRGLCYELWI